jgi:hypothetical protein
MALVTAMVVFPFILIPVVALTHRLVAVLVPVLRQLTDTRTFLCPQWPTSHNQ